MTALRHRPRQTPRERGEALIHAAATHADPMPQIARDRDEIALSRLLRDGREEWMAMLWVARPGGGILRIQSHGPTRSQALTTLSGDLAASTRETTA